MSVLGLMENTAPIQSTTPDLTSVPSTAGERFSGAWDAAQTDDRYWNIQSARRQRADKIIGDYHAMTGEKLLNPFDNAPTQKEVAENLGQPTTAIYAKRLETLRQKTADLKAQQPTLGGLPDDFLDVDSIDTSIAGQAVGARQAAEKQVGTGNGLAAFAGSAAGEMASPHGVASMFFPVSRLPTATAEAVGGAWMGTLRNVGKEALLQGAVQGAVQAAATVVDYGTRKQIGTEQTSEEIAHEILSAAGGGAVFGAAFRAAHLGILKLAGHGVEVPPAVKDAALVVESKELYGDKNALQVPAAAHEAAIDKSVADVAMNRPADVAAIVPEAPLRTAHDVARETHPELMNRYDALVQARENIQAQLNPTDEIIVGLRANVAEITERIRNAGPQTQEEAARLGAVARTREIELQEALARREGLAAGQAEETPFTASLRQQLMDVDKDMRDMLPEIRQAVGDAPVAQVGDVAPPAEAAATRLAQEVPMPPEVQRLQKMVEEPAERVANVPVAPPETAPQGKPTGETPQDKAMDAQVRQLVSEEGAATSEQKAAYERADQKEKEANVAVGCIGGGAM